MFEVFGRHQCKFAGKSEHPSTTRDQGRSKKPYLASTGIEADTSSLGTPPPPIRVPSHSADRDAAQDIALEKSKGKGSSTY